MIMLILKVENLVTTFHVGLPRLMDQLCLFPIKIIIICFRVVEKTVSLLSPPFSPLRPKWVAKPWIISLGGIFWQDFSSVFLKIAFSHSANLKSSRWLLRDILFKYLHKHMYCWRMLFSNLYLTFAVIFSGKVPYLLCKLCKSLNLSLKVTFCYCVFKNSRQIGQDTNQPNKPLNKL